MANATLKITRGEIGSQQTMNRFGCQASAVTESLSSSPSWCTQANLDLLIHENSKDRFDKHRLADTWTTRDDHDLGDQSFPKG